MVLDEALLLKKLRDTFRAEAPQKLRLLRRWLFEACRDQAAADLNRSDFLRELHNLKGISRIAGLPAIQNLCAGSERILRVGAYPPDKKEAYETIMEAFQQIEDLIPGDEAPAELAQDLCSRLSSFAPEESLENV
ncbi:MAG: Hpt domain-containing protein [Candidatus Obscuribacterales bacterium]|nr:Hpt domain-containing protein [Candidatus Obscuribacterales bacterium]